MYKKIKIKLEELTKDSTPCEICVAMNKRKVERNSDGFYYDKAFCTADFDRRRGSCIDVYKAQLMGIFLNYIEHRKPEKNRFKFIKIK